MRAARHLGQPALIALLGLLALLVVPAAGPAGAASGGLVTVRTAPAVAGVVLRLDGAVAVTDASGTASFSTADLDHARAGIELAGAQVDAGTRVELLHVATDPRHAIGARLLIAELSVERPVTIALRDRLDQPLDPRSVTGMTLRSDDGHARTVRPGDGTVWLPSATAVRGRRIPGATRTLTYRIEGVRVHHVPVALGTVHPLRPDESTWSVPLAGYPFNVTVRTVPAVASVRLRLDDETVTTGATGAATFYTGSLRDVARRVTLASPRAAPHIRVAIRHVTIDAHHGVGQRVLLMGLDVQAAVRFSFVDVAGKSVPPGRVTSVVLGGPHGQAIRVPAWQLAGPVWLAASRLTQTAPPQARPVKYTVDAVSTYGTNAVFAGGQRFDPVVQSTWLVRMHLYRLRVTAHDLVLGTSSGGTVVLTAPDGSQHRAVLHGGVAEFLQVPRGEYRLVVASGARDLDVPVRVARDQTVPMRVVSWLDVLALLVIGLTLACSVAWVGLRTRRRRALRAQQGDGVRSIARVGVVVLLATAAGAGLATSPSPARAEPACGVPAISTKVPAAHGAASFPIPAWGYYYIWYTPSSWHRAKLDEPQLGCYSSDDPAVMRAHVRMAKAAGLTGFLVSWKHTDGLDARLRMLAAIAVQEHFRLGIVYEALDFHRNPLPSSTVRRDLAWFAATYGHHPAFAADGGPVAVWTGTEDYPTGVVAAVAGAVGRRLTLLASAKSVEDYDRVAGHVDGDAYYWSSGDPATPSYSRRLAEMAADVHAHGGLWLAPAAPGFNAQALGGHRNIARAGGSTLRLSLAAALASAPDALGIISWNEWSENTYVEPSVRYGKSELAVLAEILHGRVPRTVETDSSDDVATTGGWRAWHALVVLIVLIATTVAAVEQRRRRAPNREVSRALRDEYSAMADTAGRHRPGGSESA
ncbi:MAG: hypothetical protein ACJ74O_15020 [Frankiaceae bacterium]